MKTRIVVLFAGILLGISPLLMAPTGGPTGTPSRPKFQQATVSTAAADNTVRYFAPGAAADAKNTLVRTNNAGNFAISRASDAAPTTAIDNAIVFTRTGGAFTNILIGNAVDNPSLSLLGTGGITGINSFAATGPACPQSIGGNTSVACFTSTANTAWGAVVGSNAAANSRLGLLAFLTTGSTASDVVFRVQTNGAAAMNVDGTGAISANGVALGHVCVIMWSHPTSINRSHGCPAGISVANIATGVYTITHNIGVGGAPVAVCTASGNLGNAINTPMFCTTSLYNTNDVQVNTYNTAGTATNLPQNAMISISW